MIHVPFFEVSSATSGDRRILEEDLKKTYQSASSSVGMLIGIGEKLRSRATQKRINEQYIPLAGKALPGAHYRVHKSYALILAINDEVHTCMISINHSNK